MIIRLIRVMNRMEIDLPNTPGDKYEWQYVINTDSSKIYQGITDYNQEIVLGSCIDRHVYDLIDYLFIIDMILVLILLWALIQ